MAKLCAFMFAAATLFLSSAFKTATVVPKRCMVWTATAIL